MTEWISIQHRLAKLSDYDPKTECWIWNGALLGKEKLRRYGHLTIGSRKDKTRKKISAHRASFLEFKGEIPQGKWVLHKCDNPQCINPEHLFLGDRQENVDDRQRKKRNQPVTGEKNPNCKHTLVQINQIRILRKNGWKLRDLAKKFGFKSHKSICEIMNSKKWKAEPPK